MTQVQVQAAAEDGFEGEARSVLQQLRGSVAAVLAAVPGLSSASSATDLQRALRINSKLSWQVHKFATTARTFDGTNHLPKPAAMKRFCDAARSRNVPPDLTSKVLRDVDAMNRLVDVHAGDRGTFDTMIGGLAGEEAAAQINLQHCREAYRAQSHLWGVQAKAVISLMIFRPGSTAGSVDGITVGGCVHVRRFRHDAKWILTGRYVASNDRVVGPAGVQPLVMDDQQRYGAPLLSRFCDFPAASFRVNETESGVRYIEASTNAIGNFSASTYMSAELWRDVELTRDAQDIRWLLARARVRLPSEAIYHDVLVHRDLDLGQPLLDHFGDLRSGDEALSHDETERLTCYASVAHLGSGADCIFASEYPRYAELTHLALEAAGWAAEEFEVYRCRLAYPVLPSTLVMRFAAPTPA